MAKSKAVVYNAEYESQIAQRDEIIQRLELKLASRPVTADLVVDHSENLSNGDLLIVVRRPHG